VIPMKRLAILAVFFAVTQAPVQTTGQASNHDRSKGNASQNNADPNKAKPSDPKAIPKAPESDHPKGESYSSHETKNKDSVTIAESAAVANKRDWFDYLTLFIGIVLAGITGAGVIAAWQGLPQLFRQAGSAKIAADAARDSANALVSAERAWVLASIRKTVTPFPYTSMIRMPDIVTCELIFKNYGATPAIIESFSSKTEWAFPYFEFPLPPEYAERKDARIILAPQEEKVIGTVFPVEQLPEVQSEDAIFTIDRAVFMGYVNYGGIFEGQRETKFCFGFDRENDAFIPVGSAAYNDAK
jgi:hypothetical protein